MSDSKKYYYLKLKEDFFESDEVLYLESLEEGYKYSNILLKLYLKSLKNEGKLMLNNLIPYSPEMLATVTRHSVDDITKAINLFSELGIVEKLESGAIYMLHIQNFIGKSSTEGDRIRAYRAKIQEDKNKEVQESSNRCTNVQQTYDKRTPELEIESEIESEIDIELITKKIDDVDNEILIHMTNLLNNNGLNDNQISKVLTELSKVNVDDKYNYLIDKINLMKSRNKEVPENLGYLISAIQNNWGQTKKKVKKTNFHNFSNGLGLTEEEILQHIRNINMKN